MINGHEDFEKIELEFSEGDIELYSSSKIQQYKSDVAFKTLVDGVLDDLYVVPNFQRTYRWTTSQVENLAVSLVRGMPIPPIYTFRNDKGQLEILDGQQRIISLLLYYKGKELVSKRNAHINFRKEKKIDMVMNDSDTLKDYKYKMSYFEETDKGNLIEKIIDISYNSLPDNVRRKVDYTNVTIVEIVVDNKKHKLENLYKIFANLNSGGAPLSSQELRNGIYGSSFYDMLFEVNDTFEKWRDLYGKEDKESKDVACLLRFCAMKKQVEFKNGKFIVKAFKNYNQLLNDFSKEALHFTEKEIMDYKISLERFINLCPVTYKKITLWEALFIVIDKDKNFNNITPQACYNILDNSRYKETVKSGTTGKNEIETRLEVVYDELSTIN